MRRTYVKHRSVGPSTSLHWFHKRWPYCSYCARDLGFWWGFHVWFPKRAVNRFTDWRWLP